jgi:hypothetical protein
MLRQELGDRLSDGADSHKGTRAALVYCTKLPSGPNEYMVQFLLFLDLTDLLPIDQFIDKHRNSFPWKLWTNLAFQWQVQLHGWPDGLYPVLGSLFRVEETKNHEWKKLSQPIINGSDQQVAW